MFTFLVFSHYFRILGPLLITFGHYVDLADSRLYDVILVLYEVKIDMSPPLK